MNETLQTFLLIILFVIGFGLSMFELFKIDRNLKSKKFKDRRKGYKDLKSVGNENLLTGIIEIISNIFKKIF